MTSSAELQFSEEFAAAVGGLGETAGEVEEGGKVMFSVLCEACAGEDGGQKKGLKGVVRV